MPSSASPACATGSACSINSISTTARGSGRVRWPLMRSMLRPRCKAARRSKMGSRSAPRNRLAKPLPEEWRKFLVERGVPKRKYTAVCRAELSSGRVIDQLIIEEGWVIALDKSGLAGTFEQRIDFDPRDINELKILQVA